ncbi:peptidase 1 [Striga asiatica]|uniref:Peptidase 1 n=1 Tax=Striga asiatica TaxID=4170 RepID=A0A5A7QPF0_STRAF|nr:peptidase 1 [Striga asiatica]
MASNKSSSWVWKIFIIRTYATTKSITTIIISFNDKTMSGMKFHTREKNLSEKQFRRHLKMVQLHGSDHRGDLSLHRSTTIISPACPHYTIENYLKYFPCDDTEVNSSLMVHLKIAGPCLILFTLNYTYYDLNHATQVYEGGHVIDNENNHLLVSENNHLVVVVGSGCLRGIEYWLYLNNWGPRWGRNGRGMIAKWYPEARNGVSNTRLNFNVWKMASNKSSTWVWKLFIIRTYATTKIIIRFNDKTMSGMKFHTRVKNLSEKQLRKQVGSTFNIFRNSLEEDVMICSWL